MDDAEDLQAAEILMADVEEDDLDTVLIGKSREPGETDKDTKPASKGIASTFAQLLHADPARSKCILQTVSSFHAPKLSLLGIAERVAAMTDLRSKAGIQNCYVVKGREGEPYSVQTDGVSFETAWEFADIIDVNQIRSNDIGAVLKTYGVEAARSTIIQECVSVFGAYGISVNPRHLGLIADYMTNLVDALPHSRVFLVMMVSTGWLSWLQLLRHSSECFAVVEDEFRAQHIVHTGSSVAWRIRSSEVSSCKDRCRKAASGGNGLHGYHLSWISA